MTSQNPGTATCYNCRNTVAVGIPACPFCGAVFAQMGGAPPQQPQYPQPQYPAQADPYSHGPIPEAPPQGPYPAQPPYYAHPGHQQGAPQAGYTPQQPWQSSPPPKKKGRSKIPLTILVIIVVIAALGGVYFLLIGNSGSKSSGADGGSASPASPNPTSTSGQDATAAPGGNPVGVGSGSGNPTPAPSDLDAQHDIEVAAQSERAVHDTRGVFTDDGPLLKSIDPSVNYGGFGRRVVKVGLSTDLQTVCLGEQSTTSKRYWLAVYWSGSRYVPYYTTSDLSVDYTLNCSYELVHGWAPTKSGWM